MTIRDPKTTHFWFGSGNRLSALLPSLSQLPACPTSLSHHFACTNDCILVSLTTSHDHLTTRNDHHTTEGDLSGRDPSALENDHPARRFRQPSHLPRARCIRSPGGKSDTCIAPVLELGRVASLSAAFTALGALCNIRVGVPCAWIAGLHSANKCRQLEGSVDGA